MISWYAEFIVRKPVAWTVVVLTLLVTVLSLSLAGQVDQEDDLLAFLPQTNPDIQKFYEINEQFGGLDVALVGIETEDVFNKEFLQSLKTVTRSLRETEGLDHVLSLTSVQDFTEDPVMGGVVTSELVSEIPTTEEGLEALRQKVMSRDHVINSLISKDGTAVLVYCFTAYGTEPRILAEKIRLIVEDGFPDDQKYWGGAPFISTYIYNTTQEDMRVLTPWAVVAIVIIMMFAFRDWIGTGLGLLATGVGILVSRASMVLLGVGDNIVLGSMPVILFAVGSAYSIHILARYYRNAQTYDTVEAVRKTVERTGPTVIAAGMTTVVGVLSFVTMDIEPMRTFGAFTALGIFVALLMSISFVPAMIRLTGPTGRAESKTALKPMMTAVSLFAQRRRGLVGSLLGCVFVVAAFWAAQVDNRIDQSTFFSRGSPPDLAAEFLDRRFGGSQFLQVHVTGDISDPHALREIQRLTDKFSHIEYVSQVLSVSDIVAVASEAMTGVRRIPDTKPQVNVLMGLLTGDPSLGQLVTPERDQALLHVKIRSNRPDVLEGVQHQVEHILNHEAMTHYIVASLEGEQGAAVTSRLDDLVAHRFHAILNFYGVSIEKLGDGDLAKWLGMSHPEASSGDVATTLSQFLKSDECFVDLQSEEAKAVAKALASLGPTPEDKSMTDAIQGALGEDYPDEMVVDDLMLVLDGPLGEIWREQRAMKSAAALFGQLPLDKPEGGTGVRLEDRLAAALMERESIHAGIASDDEGAKTIQFTVNGLPVLYKGLSNSVTHNQFKSLAFALGLVFIIMTLLFRSVLSGLLGTMPTMFALLMVYGGMGFLGVHLDIGTSMLASIIIGAGVDYSVHLLSSWESPESGPISDSLRVAVDDTAPAIWTNAIMVAVGFFVLTLGDAKPLQNVGGLTSAAMLAAALSTFIVIPVLARKHRYGRSS